MVQYHITLNHITNVTAAHVHRAPVGQNGGVIHPLFSSTAFTPTEPVRGSYSFLTDQRLFEMLKGDHYINFHTTQVPSGEIRGQIARYELPTREFVSWLHVTNPVTTSASGLARFRLDPELNVLHYEVDVQGLDSITSAALEQVTPMGNIELHDRQDTFNAETPLTGSRLLYSHQLLELIAGATSLRIGVSANPVNELLGKVLPLRDVFLPLAR